MIRFLSNNIATIIVASIVAIIVVLIIRKMIIDKKSGKSFCSGNCKGCMYNKNDNCKMNN